jgi:hypothetical protein
MGRSILGSAFLEIITSLLLNVFANLLKLVGCDTRIVGQISQVVSEVQTGGRCKNEA